MKIENNVITTFPDLTHEPKEALRRPNPGIFPVENKHVVQRRMAFDDIGRLGLDCPIDLGVWEGSADRLDGGNDSDYIANGTESDEKNSRNAVDHIGILGTKRGSRLLVVTDSICLIRLILAERKDKRQSRTVCAVSATSSEFLEVHVDSYERIRGDDYPSRGIGTGTNGFAQPKLVEDRLITESEHLRTAGKQTGHERKD